VGASVLPWLAVVVLATAVGVVLAGHETIGLLLAGLVLATGIFITDPLLVVVLALPGSLLIQRVGGSSTNLSAADLLVFMAAVVSLFYIHWRDATYLRRFMVGIIWFQAVLVLVVVAHPFKDDIVEWFHRWSYVAGSVLVGWVIATTGRTKQAFRLLLAGSSFLAVLALEHFVSLHFKPAQWGVYQKNEIGGIMWIAIVVAQLNPSWTGISRREAQFYKWLCVLGLLASQSRQAAILLILSLVVAFVLNPESRRRSKLILLGFIPLVIALYYSFSIAAKNDPRFNSVSTRVDQISAALHVWHLSPLLGEGLRFYNLPQYITVTAPPNVLVDNLASSGIIGSLAFVFMVVVTMRTMLRLPYVFGTLGLVILLGHYVDGLFDIYWIGAPSVAPLAIAGVSLGMADLDRTRRRAGSPVDLAVAPVVDAAAGRHPAHLSRPGSAWSTDSAWRTARSTIRSTARSTVRTLAHPVRALDWSAPPS
jgi:hypothetical protein